MLWAIAQNLLVHSELLLKILLMRYWPQHRIWLCAMGYSVELGCIHMYPKAMYWCASAVNPHAFGPVSTWSHPHAHGYGYMCGIWLWIMGNKTNMVVCYGGRRRIWLWGMGRLCPMPHNTKPLTTVHNHTNFMLILSHPWKEQLGKKYYKDNQAIEFYWDHVWNPSR